MATTITVGDLLREAVKKNWFPHLRHGSPMVWNKSMNQGYVNCSIEYLVLQCITCCLYATTCQGKYTPRAVVLDKNTAIFSKWIFRRSYPVQINGDANIRKSIY